MHGTLWSLNNDSYVKLNVGLSFRHNSQTHIAIYLQEFAEPIDVILLKIQITMRNPFSLFKMIIHLEKSHSAFCQKMKQLRQKMSTKWFLELHLMSIAAEKLKKKPNFWFTVMQNFCVLSLTMLLLFRRIRAICNYVWIQINDVFHFEHVSVLWRVYL